MVKLQRLAPADGANVWVKCEQLNPGGSIKDRICVAMIEAAENAGVLKPGDTVVEPTSGNTGIGLALACANKGYKLVLTMPASMSLERRQLLEAYGAEIVLTEPKEVMDGAMREAKRIAIERGAFMPQQFDNIENPHAHRDHTAQEILDAMCDEPIDVLVAAVGTGGTVSGVGAVLKEAALKEKWSTRIVAVEPKSSPVISGGQPGPSKIQGLNAGFVPANYHPEVVDEVILIEDRRAWETKMALAREEGLLAGISAGANVAVALDIAQKLGPDQNVVTFLCDTGERYFSLRQYFED